MVCVRPCVCARVHAHMQLGQLHASEQKAAPRQRCLRGTASLPSPHLATYCPYLLLSLNMP